MGLIDYITSLWPTSTKQLHQHQFHHHKQKSTPRMNDEVDLRLLGYGVHNHDKIKSAERYNIIEYNPQHQPGTETTMQQSYSGDPNWPDYALFATFEKHEEMTKAMKSAHETQLKVDLDANIVHLGFHLGRSHMWEGTREFRWYEVVCIQQSVTCKGYNQLALKSSVDLNVLTANSMLNTRFLKEQADCIKNPTNIIKWSEFYDRFGDAVIVGALIGTKRERDQQYDNISATGHQQISSDLGGSVPDTPVSVNAHRSVTTTNTEQHSGRTVRQSSLGDDELNKCSVVQWIQIPIYMLFADTHNSSSVSNETPREMAKRHLKRYAQVLMDDSCFIETVNLHTDRIYTTCDNKNNCIVDRNIFNQAFNKYPHWRTLRSGRQDKLYKSINAFIDTVQQSLQKKQFPTQHAMRDVFGKLETTARKWHIMCTGHATDDDRIWSLIDTATSSRFIDFYINFIFKGRKFVITVLSVRTSRW